MSKSHWDLKPLRELCSAIGDGIHATPNYVDESGYYFINGNNLKNGFVTFTENTKQVSREEFNKYYLELDDNTLLMSINGTLGSLALFRGEQVILGKSAAFINCKSINRKFCYYYLQSDYAQKKMWNEATGSTIKNLSLASLKNFPIPVPESEEQQKIAAVLSSLDAKIELNQHIIVELESMAKTLYDYWFVQFEFPNEKGKPYKSNGGKMVWNEALKRKFPDSTGWEVGSLLDIADYINGLPCQKYRTTENEFLRVIKIKEMHEGFSTSSELVKPEIPQEAIIENGDVLFAWSASLEVQIWSGGKGALNQHIFKVTSEKYPKSFYYYQLVNYLQHFKMMADKRKTTMGHITQEHLQQSRIVIPPQELTLELEKIISPIFKQIITIKIENQRLAELRDWLLPMLMNGQVKVN